MKIDQGTKIWNTKNGHVYFIWCGYFLVHGIIKQNIRAHFPLSNIFEQSLSRNNHPLLVRKKKSINTPGHYLRKYGQCAACLYGLAAKNQLWLQFFRTYPLKKLLISIAVFLSFCFFLQKIVKHHKELHKQPPLNNDQFFSAADEKVKNGHEI